MPKRSIQPFKGFLAGKSASVQVPTAFFSQLLPLIDDLAELKLTVYCFWALQQREGKFRYVRLRDLLEDKIFLAGFDDDPARAEQLLREALQAAVERGTLLHVVVPKAKGDEHLYFMTPKRGVQRERHLNTAIGFRERIHTPFRWWRSGQIALPCSSKTSGP